MAPSERTRPGFRVGAAVAAAAFASGCSTCPAPPVAGAEVAEAELRAFLRGMVAAVRSTPCSAPLRGQLAMAYDANGFVNAAAATYAQAAALGDDPRWPYHLAIARAARGDLEAALTAVDAALALDDDYAPAWLWRGQWLLDLDRAAMAARAFANAIEVARHPAHVAAAQAGAGRAALRRGDVAHALATLEAAVARFDHPHLHWLLRRARQRAPTRADPQAPVEASLAARPPTPLRWPDPRRDAIAAYVRGLSGTLALAKKMLQAGRADAAVALLEPLRQTHGQDNGLTNDLGIALRLAGREQDALVLLGEGLRRQPDYPPFHFNVAVLHERLGDEPAAERHYREALRQNPNLPGAPRRLANLLVRNGRVEQARELLERFARTHPGRADLRFVAGLVAGAQQDWPAAVTHLRAAVAAAPTHQRAHLSLATALAEVGDFAAAGEARNTAERLGVAASEIENARAHADRLAGATTPGAPLRGAPLRE